MIINEHSYDGCHGVPYKTYKVNCCWLSKQQYSGAYQFSLICYSSRQSNSLSFPYTSSEIHGKTVLYSLLAFVNAFASKSSNVTSSTISAEQLNVWLFSSYMAFRRSCIAQPKSLQCAVKPCHVHKPRVSAYLWNMYHPDFFRCIVSHKLFSVKSFSRKICTTLFQAKWRFLSIIFVSVRSKNSKVLSFTPITKCPHPYWQW